MALALRTRERRLLLVAVLVVGGLLAHLYVIEPLLASRKVTRERIRARQSLLVRQQRLLARGDGYAREVAELQAEVQQQQARLLPGDRAPLAASELSKLVRATATEAGLEVRSERVLPPVERGGYTEVPIEVTLAGPIRAAITLLHRLDGAPILLTVPDVRVRVVSVTAPRELSVTVALAGYIHSPAPAPAPAAAGAGTPRTPPEPPRRTP